MPSACRCRCVSQAQESTQLAERHAATLSTQLSTANDQISALQDSIR